MTHELLKLGAVLVRGADVDDTQAGSVGLPVIRLGFEIGTTILVVLRRRVYLYFDLLEVVHDGDGVESAGSCHNQLLYIAIFQDFNNCLFSL